MASQSSTSKARINRYRRYLVREEKLYLPAVELESDISGVQEETAIYVLGPVLNAFVVWVLRNAVRSGKKRLYFLARDGYMMYRAAIIYTKRFSIPVECRYLCCSRYSLRIPMFHMDLKDAMEYICRDSIGVNLTRIMNRAGLDRKEQERVLEDIGESGQGEIPVSYACLEKIKDKLWHSEVFLEAMVRHSKEAVPALTGYLTQEGLLDGTEDAMVDSGWVGSMQKTLNQVLKNMGRKTVLEGYYWGLYELPEKVKRESYHCYYFSPEGQLRAKVGFNNNLFETIFSAPHGMTLGYEEKDGSYEPVFDHISSERRKKMESLEKVLNRYVRHAAAKLRDLDEADCDRQKKVLRKLVTLFMSRPSPEEAESFGRMIFCDDVLEYGNRQLAVKMSRKDLRDNHVISKVLAMLGISKKKIRESAWYEGSAVRYSRHPAWHLFQYGIYKYLLNIRQMWMWRRSNEREKERQREKTEYGR